MKYDIDTLSKTIAYNIRTICKEQDVSIKIMLKDLQISENFIYGLPGVKETSIVKVLKICDYLDVTLDELLIRRW